MLYGVVEYLVLITVNTKCLCVVLLMAVELIVADQRRKKEIIHGALIPGFCFPHYGRADTSSSGTHTGLKGYGSLEPHYCRKTLDTHIGVYGHG